MASRVLLDTNILIHREGHNIQNEDIGILFRWLDRLGYEKCIHPLSVDELHKHGNEKIRSTFKAKIASYHTLRTIAPDHPDIIKLRNKDKTQNSNIDTSILNELLQERVEFLITEDRGIHRKASSLSVAHLVFTIDEFIDKAVAENPELTDYKVLSVNKIHFGDVDLNNPFFDSFRDDYPNFNKWFNKKSDEIAYICTADNHPTAFLYLKVEGDNENYSDIQPPLPSAKRLKIGTLKVTSTGYKIGKRFLKIIFDNALKNKVDEIYVTIFKHTYGHKLLIELLKDWGFYWCGKKVSKTNYEHVYCRNINPEFDTIDPKKSFPKIYKGANKFLVAIHPEYHTDLLPDSFLRTEQPKNFIDNHPHRNALHKVYISRSFGCQISSGDTLIFYRTGGYYKSVTTTIGVVLNIIDNIPNLNTFIKLCRKRSVFTDSELEEQWNWNPKNRPFVVNFLYVYSFKQRLNLQKLIELGVITDVNSAPRGFLQITDVQFNTIMSASNANEYFIVD